MPVRSLNSSVVRWPDKATADRAVRSWSSRLVQERSQVVAVGYFGSYARGDWGVGSDLDLIVVLRSSALPFERRAAELETRLPAEARLAAALPVPADLLVYTSDEWRKLAQEPAGRRISEEVVWVYRATT